MGAPGSAPGAPTEQGAAGGPGQAPAAEAGAAGGPEAKAAKAEATLTAEERAKKAEGELTAEDGGASGGAGAAAQAAEAKGESGKPGEAKAAKGKKDEGADGAPGAKTADEDDLVDPDADRPDFGGRAADEEDEEDEGDGEAEGDDGFASVAARAGRGAAAVRGKAAKRKPIDPAYVTVVVMGAALLALGGLIWFGRSLMIQMWPGIQGFYQSVGAEPKKQGDGLKIAESSKRLQRIGGIETLVVRGFVSNIGELPTSVPNLKLELYNEKKEVIQDADAKACSALLDPKASCEFELRMELPQMAAAKGGYGIVWAK